MQNQEVKDIYNKNVYKETLSSGIYHYFDPFKYKESFILPAVQKDITIINQEVLSKDNIAFRFSFLIYYKIVDGKKFLESIAIEKEPYYSLLLESENIISNTLQVMIKDKISQYGSIEINRQRSEILNDMDVKNLFENRGIEIRKVVLRDVTFPKKIQDIFSNDFEIKLGAISDLEKARTVVATTRTLKNAAAMIKDDEGLKFIKYLESIEKISKNGRHTFVIGNQENSQ